MKNRWKALFLAAALTAGSFSCMTAFAQDSTEGVVEALSEAESEAAAAADGADGQSEFAPYYDQMKLSVASTLEQLSAMTDEQLTELMEGTDAQNAAIAAGWMGVKDELGVFVEPIEQTITEEDNIITILTKAKYDGVSDNTTVNVNYVYDVKKSTTSLDWDIKYPASKLIREAGLNTLLGLGTVFIVLVFLSLVIGNIHWIPDLIEGRKKKAEPVKAAPSAPVPAPAPAVVEEDLTSDEELVAVIAAAIAASEEVAPDGFVVRSIRKAKRRSALEY